MSLFSYLFGLILVLVGAIWTFMVIAAPGYEPGNVYSGYVVLGKILAAAPGISTFTAGMLFLAIGSGLDYLARIARSTRETSRLLSQQFNLPQ